MNRFVQFVVVLILSSSIMALLIVVSTNQTTRKTKARQLVKDEQNVQRVMKEVSGKIRRVNMIVEWQKVHGDKNITETALLWRIQIHDEKGQLRPFYQRFVIQGDNVHLDALYINLQELKDNPKIAFLQGSTLCLFNHLYGEGEKPDDTNRIVPVGSVPLGYRSRFSGPSLFENILWQRLWTFYNSPVLAKKNGVTFTEVPPISRLVKTGALYEVCLGKNLGLEIIEHHDPSTVAAMLKDAAVEKKH